MTADNAVKSVFAVVCTLDSCTG